jgi:hemoglobin-like flavoprotein
LELVSPNRLDQLDNNGKFDAVLASHSGGKNKIAAKGAILVRIIDFVLKIDINSKATDMALYMLGKSHYQKAIRPWQYSTFVQTLLNTIASRLGENATTNVMESWVNLFAYVMQGMLPHAIKGRVVETEAQINTSSEFAAGRVSEEIQEMEEVRELSRKMKGKDRDSSSGSSTFRSGFGGVAAAASVAESTGSRKMRLAATTTTTAAANTTTSATTTATTTAPGNVQSPAISPSQ